MSEHLCVTLVPLFNHLDLTDQRKINQLVSHHSVEKGALIFQPGDKKLVIIARGSMKVYQLSANGKEQLLRVVEPGGHEGDNQLFGATNETIFGEALEKTEVCILNQADFNRLLLNYPPLALKLLEMNARKSLQLEQQTQFLSMEKVEERLAIYLLNLVKSEGALTFTLPMKMKELATFLGTTPETLSRKLKRLEHLGLIARRGRTIEILDGDSLENI